jgi:hypothetical protein
MTRALVRTAAQEVRGAMRLVDGGSLPEDALLRFPEKGTIGPEGGQGRGAFLGTSEEVF